MGGQEREQPKLLKEATWPPMMIEADAAPAAPQPMPQDTAQSHPHPRIDRAKRVRPAVFEVLKPPPEQRIEIGHDRREAVTVRAAGPLPHSVFEFPQTLLARDTIPPREVVTEEIKAL